MSENPEIRFARLERAPAYKNVSEAILKDIIDGRQHKLADGVKLFGSRHSSVFLH